MLVGECAAVTAFGGRHAGRARNTRLRVPRLTKSQFVDKPCFQKSHASHHSFDGRRGCVFGKAQSADKLREFGGRTATGLTGAGFQQSIDCKTQFRFDFDIVERTARRIIPFDGLIAVLDCRRSHGNYEQ
jgi:hypothetical protein